MDKDLFFVELRARQKQKYCSMKTRFYLHDYLNNQGQKQIIFSVSIQGKRKRIYTGYFCEPSQWDAKAQRCKNKKSQLNLIIDNIQAKATEIKTFYFLSQRELSLDNFLVEFHKKSPSYDFNSFMLSRISESIHNPNTLKKHRSIHKKLKDYKERIPFNSIDLDWISQYRKHLASIGNGQTTINSNIKIIKKYLLEAKKKGVYFNFDLDEIKPGSCSGNRTALNKEQVNKLKAFYFSDFIKENWKISLGYFLIACYSGLRVSDVLRLRRIDLNSEVISIKIVKTQKQQNIKLNKTAKEIIANCPELFDKFYTEQTINKHLREIAKNLGIHRKISMHIGRHTFATAYIRAGGDVMYLQKLLGHSKLETTQIYTHITEDEANDTIFILDEY